jgi:hypothetical protein
MTLEMEMQISAIANATAEISEELRLWPPAPPRNILFIGRESVFEAIREQLTFAKVTCVCEADCSKPTASDFWKKLDWGNNYEVLLCVDLFGSNETSRSSEFFRRANICLRSEGRIVAIERVVSESLEYFDLLRASTEAGCGLQSIMALNTDRRWSCIVFQWEQSGNQTARC